MFSIATRPPTTALRYDESIHPSYSYGGMDVDNDDLGEGPSTTGPKRVVSPGEAIINSKEFMRCAISI